MSKSIVRITLFGLGLGLVFAPRESAAQSPAAGPDEAACQGKASGDACTLLNGQVGTCGPGTCSRLDYSQGSPPKAIEEPCTVCKVGPPALGAETGTTEPATTEPATTEPATTEPTRDEPADDEPPKTSSRCSVMDRSASGDLGGLLLLGLALAWSRRRSLKNP